MKDMTIFTNKQLEVMATQGDARGEFAKRELKKRGESAVSKSKSTTTKPKQTTRKPRATKTTDKEGK